MPRIYTSASDPIDFCAKHMPNNVKAYRKYGKVGDGPDNRGNCYGYEAEHPPYSDDDDMYRCEVCGCHLGDRDN
jgi:hypothetical protein